MTTTDLPLVSSPATTAPDRPRTGRRTAAKIANVATSILQLLVAAAFFAAGSAKILGAPAMVETFDRIGFGEWFRYFTGATEIAGAILLLVPSRSGIGALWLAAVMIGAIATHLFLIGGDATPAIVLLALSLAIAWSRRGRTMQLLRETRNPEARML